MTTTWQRAWIAAGALALGACAGPPPQPEPSRTPVAELTIASWAGSPVAPRDRPPAESADGLAFDLRLRFVERTLEAELEPALLHARLVSTRSGEPVAVARTRRGRTARFAVGAAARDFEQRLEDGTFGPFIEVRSGTLTVAPDTTTLLRWTSTEPGRALAPPAVELFLHCLAAREGSPPAWMPALGFPGSSAQPAAEEDEILVLDVQSHDESAEAVVVLPAPFDVETSGTLVVEIRPRPEDSGDELAATPARPDAGPTEESDAAVRADFAIGLRGLASPEQRRPSLVYLATRTGASLAESVAITASDEGLERWWERLEPQVDPQAPPPATELGWLLERSAVELLAEAAQEESDESERHPNALLLLHTGELGRHPLFLTEALGTVDGLESWRERVVSANRTLLEDNSPAARVRAYDWLRVRGEEPPGYDPLASREERRAALAAAASAIEDSGE